MINAVRYYLLVRYFFIIIGENRYHLIISMNMLTIQLNVIVEKMILFGVGT